MKGRWHGVKLLSDGALDRKLLVRVHRVSAKAREAVEKAGGSVELVPLDDPRRGSRPPGALRQGRPSEE